MRMVVESSEAYFQNKKETLAISLIGLLFLLQNRPLVINFSKPFIDFNRTLMLPLIGSVRKKDRSVTGTLTKKRLGAMHSITFNKGEMAHLGCLNAKLAVSYSW